MFWIFDPLGFPEYLNTSIVSWEAVFHSIKFQKVFSIYGGLWNPIFIGFSLANLFVSLSRCSVCQPMLPTASFILCRNCTIFFSHLNTKKSSIKQRFRINIWSSNIWFPRLVQCGLGFYAYWVGNSSNLYKIPNLSDNVANV